jgi:flagellar motility protein MotE (MotC chaperone)
MRSSSPIRLLPILVGVIVLVALFRLGGHLLDDEPAVSAFSAALAQDAQDGADGDGAEAAAEVATEPEAAAVEVEPEAAAVEAEPEADSRPADVPQPESGEPPMISAAEQELLESLQERRLTLDRREQDVLLRERLLQATERRLEQRIAELRAIEARIEASFGRYETAQREQLEGLVGMYENMKPKDAARIFDRLDITVLVEVVEQMQTRKMSPILAKMDPAVAERLTVELAARAAMRTTPTTGTSAAELQDP